MAKPKSCLGIVGIGAVVLVAVGVVGVFGADVYLSVQLSAQQQKFLEAGVPMTAEDLGIVSVVAEENAATLYSGAVEAIEAAEDGEGGDDFDPEAYRERFLAMHANPCAERGDAGRGDEEELLPLTAEELAAVDAWFARFAPVYEELEGAWGREKSQWHAFSGETPVGTRAWGEAMSTGLGRPRALARQLVFKATWEHARGDTAAAFETLALTMRLANDLADEPLLITGLVRIAIGRIALGALEGIVSQDGGATPIPARLQAELDSLQDREMLVRMLDGEHWYSTALMNEMAGEGNILSRITLYSPSQRRTNEYYQVMREAVGESDFGRRQHLLEPLEIEAREMAEASGFRLPFHILAEIAMPAYLRSLEATDHLLAETYLAEQGIALVQYKAAHGAYPETLEEIGDLLGGGPLPQDPFTGEPFIYARDGDGFRLSSGGPSTGPRRDKVIGWCADR